MRRALLSTRSKTSVPAKRPVPLPHQPHRWPRRSSRSRRPRKDCLALRLVAAAHFKSASALGLTQASTFNLRLPASVGWLKTTTLTTTTRATATAVETPSVLSRPFAPQIGLHSRFIRPSDPLFDLQISAARPSLLPRRTAMRTMRRMCFSPRERPHNVVSTPPGPLLPFRLLTVSLLPHQQKRQLRPTRRLWSQVWLLREMAR